jgi:methionyl-tRNA synthetase
VQRYNSDLANGLGNLASRVFTMIHQYREGLVPESDGDNQVAQETHQAVEAVLAFTERLEFNRALERIWQLISVADKFIVERAPWKLAKDPGHRELLDRTLYSAAETLRIVCGLASPYLPETIEKIWHQFGFETEVDALRANELHWGGLRAGQRLRPVSPVYPRLDVKATVEKMIEGEMAERVRQDRLLGRVAAQEAPAVLVEAPPAVLVDAPVETGPKTPGITIDDFVKVDLRVGMVKSAAPVKGADKLLHMSVDIGEAEPRSS